MTRKNDDQPLNEKQVFTTGEAARVCNVSQQTIIRCFDAGRLQGFKVPGSRFRRIPRNELLRFMKQNNIPLERLDSGPLRVLVVGLSPRRVDPVIAQHSVDREVEIRHAENAWEAGFLTHEFRPNLTLIAADTAGFDERSVRARIENDPALCDGRIVCVSHECNGNPNGSGSGSASLDAVSVAVRELLSA